MKKTPNPPKKSSPVTPPPAGPIPASTDLAALLTRWPMVPIPPRLPLDPRAAASLVLSEILPVFSRKPIFGPKVIILSTIAIGILGFTTWVHHMFVSGVEDL